MAVKVALLHNMIGPYRVPLFNALAADPRLDLRVFCMSTTESHRSWKLPEGVRFRLEYLRGRALRVPGWETPVHLNPGIIRTLRRFGPDAVIVGGYDSLSNQLVVAMRRRLGSPRMVFWCESTGLGKPESEGLAGVVKRWFVGRMDAALAPGRLAREYVMRFARPGTPCEILPNVIDESLFRLDTARREILRRKLRGEVGIEGTCILFSGRFIERKGLPELLEAFEAAAFDRPVTLVLVGEGPLLGLAEEAARRIKAPKRIVILPFRQVAELPEVYASADMLVVPSRHEPWGFVVIEAMFCGTPVAASDEVGSAPELVHDGETGWMFPARNRDAIRSTLETAVRQDLAAFGARAQEVASAYASLPRAVDAFARAVGAA
jgi:glycosyltransferase involved in cell wall biosynthesis